MSTLLEQASLIMIPSGYKEDVVYSVIPENGNGDLSFTRASNGTRINSSGLVEDVAWNMLQQSETIGVSPWVNQNVTITNNATTAPNGTSTAEKIIENTSNGYHQVYQEIFASGSVVGQDYTFSCYAKASERTKISFALQTPDISIATFDLINGTASITGGSGTAGVAIESVGNGWYRCSIYRLNTTTGYIYGNLQMNDGSSTSYTGDGTSGVFVWGAQLNIGSTAKPYFPTTDRLNVPRLTYQNGGGGCPSLLLEKQSTNLCLYSEQIDNASWDKVNGSGGSAPVVTANYGISPDGTQNADRIQLARTTAAGSYSYVYQTITLSASATYTVSVYLKSLSGTPTISIALDSVGYDHVVTMTTEWARYEVEIVAGGSFDRAQLLLYQAVASTSLTADFLAWGFQVEQSSYPTSYIPTTSSSATRVADACSKTGISSLIGQSQGTIFADVVPFENLVNDVIALNLSVNNSVAITMSNSIIKGLIFNSGNLVIMSGGSYTKGNRYKIAVVYKNNNSKIFVNGALINTDTSNVVFNAALNDLYNYPTNYYEGANNIKFNSTQLYKTALTDAECIALTTL